MYVCMYVCTVCMACMVWLLSIPKTKLLVAAAGSGIMQDDLMPICIDGDVIETVSCFCYLESIVEGCGGVTLEVNARIARAATVFGALQLFL